MSETTLPILPDEVITDNILIRLPAKSVGRFRCVSKPWRSLLSGTKFARDHLNFHQDHEPEDAIAAVSPEQRDLTLSLLNFTTESSTKAATFPYWAKLSGSCHGLVITHQDFDDLYLYNPITLEKAYVEPPEFGIHHKYSLGYDSSRGDYKIVSLSKKKFCIHARVHVYSVRGKSWRRLGMCSYAQQYLGGGEFLNGFTHWLFGKNMELFIVSFDYAREQLGTVPPPRNLDYQAVFGDGGFLEFGVVGGCLTVGHDITSEDRFGIRFWMMREYGVRDSWTEYTIWWPEDTGRSRANTPVGVLGEDEFLLRYSEFKTTMYVTKFSAYNWRTGVWRDLPFGGIAGVVATMAFRQSLISPNYGVL